MSTLRNNRIPLLAGVAVLVAAGGGAAAIALSSGGDDGTGALAPSSTPTGSGSPTASVTGSASGAKHPPVAKHHRSNGGGSVRGGSELVAVPNVLGTKLTAARSQLSAHGFATRVEYDCGETDGKVEPDIVTGEIVDGDGRIAPRGSTVVLTVVPEGAVNAAALLGADLQDARRITGEGQLHAAFEPVEPADGWRVSVVQYQGDRLQEGDLIPACGSVTLVFEPREVKKLSWSTSP